MKKISLIIFLIFTSILLSNKVLAANANINVYSNKSLVIVGDTVTVTVKLSGSSKLGSWNFDVVPSSNLALVSTNFEYGGLYVADKGGGSTTKSYTYTFRAKSSGMGSVSIRNARVIDFDTEKNMSVNTQGTSFKMMTRSELESTYSKNNNLSSLKIEGMDELLSFDKNTLEYNVELEYGTKEINVIANVEDNLSSVNGSGIVSLSQGMNTIKVVVTAQNGSTKTYVINALVKELDPINVNFNGAEYTVIREKDFLPKANIYFQEKMIQIDSKDVPAYYNEVNNITLVGLKDKSGNSKLYMYDGNYKEYQEYAFNSLIIYLLDMPKDLIPKGYDSRIIKIGEKEINAYYNSNFQFPIVYGLNLETGEKNIYKYDGKENTLQRFENIESKNEKIYFNVMIGMVGFIFLSYIGFIYTNKKQKHNFITDSVNMDISNISADPISEVLNIKTKKEIKRQKKLAKKNKKNSKINIKDDDMADL